MLARVRSALPVLVAAGLTFLTAGCGSSSHATSTSPGGSAATVTAGAHLDVNAFSDLISRPGVVVLDVRTPAEFAAGHLSGAKNVDVEATDFASQIGSLDHSATYAVYCRTGVRSGMALQQMLGSGFTQVVDLSGGITAWTGAGKPVTTS